ncbi:hypothetical protein PMI19_02418 [Pseudomonas sp. GM16]|nr:hypothetical protein PMI19_02418 [Pseudomonas sp. GM16]
MNIHAMAQSAPRDTEGISPSPVCPCDWGFPPVPISKSSTMRTAALWRSQREASLCKVIGYAGCPGNYCPIAADRPDKC